jgi:hypothetical protein
VLLRFRIPAKGIGRASRSPPQPLRRNAGIAGTRESLRFGVAGIAAIPRSRLPFVSVLRRPVGVAVEGVGALDAWAFRRRGCCEFELLAE